MEEELRERMEKTERLLEEVREWGREAELDGVRHRLLCAYAAGQYDAWAKLIKVAEALRGAPAKEEEDE